jgi:hypothetical protein
MRARLVLAAIAVATGCGRLRFDDHGDGIPPDGTTIADSGCTLGPWSSPRALTELSSSSDDYGPWLSADRLTAVFSSDRTGAFAIYIAQRSTVQSPFAAPTVIPLGASTYGDPYLSPDGLTLWVDTDSTAILSARRATVTDAFATPIVEAELAVGGAEFNPSLSLDQLQIAFDVTESPEVIYTATRGSATDPFNAPVLAPGLNLGEQNCCMSFSGDGTFVLLGSDIATPGVQHIFQAADHGDGTFGQLLEFPPTLVDSNGTDDSDPYITPGGDAVIFASRRGPSLGGYDVFEIDRDCL